MNCKDRGQRGALGYFLLQYLSVTVAETVTAAERIGVSTARSRAASPRSRGAAEVVASAVQWVAWRASGLSRSQRLLVVSDELDVVKFNVLREVLDVNCLCVAMERSAVLKRGRGGQGNEEREGN